jgi:exonuclease VII large subunit
VGPIKKSNQIVGLTFIATDITRRKKSEQELNKYRAHLQNLVSERTQKLKTANQELNHYNRLFNRELNQVLDKMSSTLQEMQALSTTASDNRLKEKVEILSAAVEHLIGQFNKIKSGNNAAEQ